MGGKHFTVLCIVSRNGYRVNTTALIDTGANGFAFINTAYTNNVAKFLNAEATQLERPVQVKGYNGQAGQPVTHVLKLHICLNGRRQFGIPFCILDLGSHDIILGRK
jgi:predicted aspartyl protease